MKIPGSGEKQNGKLLELASQSAEAVKVTTRSSSKPTGAEKSEIIKEVPDTSNADHGISVKLGLAKYLSQELDPEKINKERLEKIADIKSRIAAGTYLSSVPSDKVAEKLLEEAGLEAMDAGKIAGNQ